MLGKFVESPLWNALDPDAWFSELSEIGKRHNFEYTIFALSARDNLPFDEAYYKCNHSVVWRKIYEQKRYSRIDPIVRHCLSHLMPLVWGPADFAESEERFLYEQGCGFGLRWGVALPIHGPKHEVGMLCFATSAKLTETPPDLAHDLPHLGLVRDMAYQTGLRFAKQSARAVAPKLTPREMECLRWMVSGKSTWEISMILKRSEATINYHVMNIRNKLGVHSRSAAMIKAMGMGLLEA